MKDLKIRGETSNLIVSIADEEALEGRNLCCSFGTTRTADSPMVGTLPVFRKIALDLVL